MKYIFSVCSFVMLLLIGQFNVEAKEIYVALGDSLAAGQTPYMEIDAGYTDYIALALQKNNNLQAFTKELAFPGYTTAQTITSIQSEEAQRLLKSASLITISAGANDLLRLVSVQASTGTVRFNQLSANYALNEVNKNMNELLKQLQQMAPNAKVYVIGYYFPYVSIHEEQQQGIKEQLAILNELLKQSAESNDAIFVSVAQAFEKEPAKLLPNYDDVHPTQMGYLKMANEFLKQYDPGERMLLNESEIPPANPISFEQLLSTFSLEETESHEEDENLVYEQTIVYPNCKKKVV